MKKIICLLLVGLLFISLAACGGDSYDQRETLERAGEKNAIGAPLTKDEQRVWDSYKNWEKEYDAQQYNKQNY